MPYIDKERRKLLNPAILRLVPITAGELNYCITMIIQNYVAESNLAGNYSSHNEAMGVLECIKFEYYRRSVAPFEDGKIEENGDVY